MKLTGYAYSDSALTIHFPNPKKASAQAEAFLCAKVESPKNNSARISPGTACCLVWLAVA